MPSKVASLVKASPIGQIADMFSPEMPDIETPDPVAKQAGLATAQANERSLIGRKGLQTTKVVRRNLLKQKGRQKFGGSST